METAKEKKPRKPRKPKRPDGFVVMQNGGSSMDWDSCTYDTIEDAESAIREIKAATYDATDAFPIPPDLAKAFRLVPGAEGEFLSLLDDICRASVTRDFSDLEPDEDEPGEDSD